MYSNELLTTSTAKVAAYFDERRDSIQVAKALGLFKPQVIRDYAELMLADEFGYPVIPAPHHNEWLKLFCDDSIEKLLIISPPGSAKTTWLIQAYLGCRLGFYPDQNYILGSVTDGVAEKRSLALRNTVESDLWQSIFLDVEKDPRMKWDQTEWSIRSKAKFSENKLHPTVSAYGVGSASIGGRANILFGDDLLSRENTYTQGQRDKFADWMENSFLTRLQPNGRVILIGTAWNAADYYAKIRRETKGWVICHCNSYQENGFSIFIHRPDKSAETKQIHNENVLWSEHLPEEKVLEIKKTTQDHIWQTTWQGFPTSPKGQIFLRDWWHNKNRFNIGDGDVAKRYLSIDTALSDKDTAAKSAIVVGELTSRYLLRIPLVWAEHATFPQLVDKVVELAIRYKVFRIVIENKISGISLVQVLKQHPNKEIVEALKEFNPRVAKEARWGWASQHCRNDKVLLPYPTEQSPWLADFETKLYEAPDVVDRDELDAFSQLVIFVEPFLVEAK